MMSIFWIDHFSSILRWLIQLIFVQYIASRTCMNSKVKFFFAIFPGKSLHTLVCFIPSCFHFFLLCLGSRIWFYSWLLVCFFFIFMVFIVNSLVCCFDFWIITLRFGLGKIMRFCASFDLEFFGLVVSILRRCTSRLFVEEVF